VDSSGLMHNLIAANLNPRILIDALTCCRYSWTCIDQLDLLIHFLCCEELSIHGAKRVNISSHSLDQANFILKALVQLPSWNIICSSSSIDLLLCFTNLSIPRSKSRWIPYKMIPEDWGGGLKHLFQAFAMMTRFQLCCFSVVDSETLFAMIHETKLYHESWAFQINELK